MSAQQTKINADRAEINRLFNAILRFVIDALKEAIDEPDEEKCIEKLNKIYTNLQKSIKD